MRSEVSVFIAQLLAPDVDTRMDCDVHWYVSYNICLTNLQGGSFFGDKRPSLDIVYDVFFF